MFWWQFILKYTQTTICGIVALIFNFALSIYPNATLKCSFIILDMIGLDASTAGDRCTIANVEAAKHECHDVYAGGHHGQLETICEK